MKKEDTALAQLNPAESVDIGSYRLTPSANGPSDCAHECMTAVRVAELLSMDFGYSLWGNNDVDVQQLVDQLHLGMSAWPLERDFTERGTGDEFSLADIAVRFADWDLKFQGMEPGREKIVKLHITLPTLQYVFEYSDDDLALELESISTTLLLSLENIEGDQEDYHPVLKTRRVRRATMNENGMAFYPCRDTPAEYTPAKLPDWL